MFKYAFILCVLLSFILGYFVANSTSGCQIVMQHNNETHIVYGVKYDLW